MQPYENNFVLGSRFPTLLSWQEEFYNTWNSNNNCSKCLVQSEKIIASAWKKSSDLGKKLIDAMLKNDIDIEKISINNLVEIKERTISIKFLTNEVTTIETIAQAILSLKGSGIWYSTSDSGVKGIVFGNALLDCHFAWVYCALIKEVFRVNLLNKIREIELKIEYFQFMNLKNQVDQLEIEFEKLCDPHNS